MAITTVVDAVNTFKYTGQDLNVVAKNYGMNVADLLKGADREDDSLEGSINALAIGDVIIIDKAKVQTLATPKESEKTTDKKEDDPIFTEEKVTGAIVGGTSAALVCAGLGAKYGGTAGSFFGPLGTVAGVVAGAAIGAVVGWWIGDACD